MPDDRARRADADSSVVEGLETALDHSDNESVRYHVRQALQAERIADTGPDDESATDPGVAADDD